MSEKNEIVDFTALEDMAEGSEDFIRSVLKVFMENTPEALKKLVNMVEEKANYEDIKKQAHFLKSSFGIVQVVGIHQKLQTIENFAQESGKRQEIESLTREVDLLFRQAIPIINKKMRA